MTFNRLKKICIAILLLNFFSISSYSEEKIAFVNINYILSTSIAGKDLNNQLNKDKKKILEELNKIENNLQEEEKKIITSKNVLSKEELNKKIAAFQKKVNDLKVLQNKKNQELNKQRNTLTNKFMKILNTIIAEHAKENSLSLVLPKNAIVLGRKDLDISEKILEKVNLKIKTIK